MGDEVDEDHEFWHQLDVSPWGYILVVLRRDADRSSGSRDRRN